MNVRITSKHVGALLGLGIGWIIVRHGLVEAVFVLVVVAIGWIVGRIVDGELEVQDLLPRRREPDDYP